jgi:hypothetical protein
LKSPRSSGKETPEFLNSFGIMADIKGSSFQDRQAATAKAKSALLEKFKARPKPDDPAVVEREEKRRAVLEARAVREAERARLRAIRDAEEKVRREAEEAARIERERLDAEERERDKEEQLRMKAELEVQKKAERDARYAARKARKAQRKQEIQRYR